MSIVKEFQDFIARGNALDMAVGIIMGGAFNKIVTSIVNNLVMPPIGYGLQGRNFEQLGWTLQEQVMEGGKEIKPQIVIGFGAFASAIIEFFIIALTVFFIVKFVNHLAAYREALTPAFLREQEAAAEAAADDAAAEKKDEGK
jgi:large conductance mechanosensitive channel